ncbi:MAG: hypothetical protein IAG13_17585 [Deltaproteobacteria bacterium]|nr:hypothetical protein [Nannocystaceae bacterium]
MSRPFDHRVLADVVAEGATGAAFLRELLEQRGEPVAIDPDEALRFVTRAAMPETVVFVAVHHGNFPSLEYLAEVLRDRGRPVVAMYLQGDAPADRFDEVLCCRGSLATLAEVLARLPARAIYLQAHGRWAFLSRLIATVHPGLRVVQELWDWMDAFVPPERAHAFIDAGVFGEAELATIREAEQWARTRTAAFVHKHGGAVLDEVVADARVPELRIFPCPPRAWMRPPVPRRSGPWRCVHSGQLKPSTSSRAAFGDLHYLPMIELLTRQSIAVTAYGAAGGSDDEYAHADIEGFSFHARIEVRALVDALHGAHDFGLLLYRFDDDLAVGTRHLQTALASKLFVYLAAGLPVLVSPELEFMAELVRTHGIGLVIEPGELPRLGERLDACDFAGLQAAVARAQRGFCAEHTCDDVLALLEQVGR